VAIQGSQASCFDNFDPIKTDAASINYTREGQVVLHEIHGQLFMWDLNKTKTKYLGVREYGTILRFLRGGALVSDFGAAV